MIRLWLRLEWLVERATANWYVPMALNTVLIAIVMLGAVYFYTSLAGATRGLCELNANRISDKRRQIENTQEYLDSPRVERELAAFIRSNSLPRLRRELRFERAEFPRACADSLQE